MKSTTFRHLVNLWPPFLFTGIRCTGITGDYRAVDVALTLRWFNRNYVGTHFGGSLFAMTDPWYMLMLLQNLGRDYYVWDQRSTIEFIAPGRGTVRAEFRIDGALLETIRNQTAAGAKYLPEFMVDIRDANQELVARVHKTIYVRKKPGVKSAQGSAA
jgi:acyl-coenzyme A thioesterase PaaI-like protein